MTFYLKAPRGMLNLHNLEECVKERLLCYNYLKSGNLEISHFQYLVEDSSLDRTGHFVLRLMACCCNTFENDFIYNELKLLRVRLNSYDVQDLKLFLKRLLKHTREVLNQNKNSDLKQLLVVFIRVTSYMLRNAYLNHIFKIDHQDCEACILEVPFYFCISMVAKRQVNLQYGFAQIPCTLWKRLLLSLYETYIKTIIKHTKNNGYITYALEDPRLKDILKIVKNYSLKNDLKFIRNNPVTFDASNMSEEVKLFPLCMLILFKVLEKTNRLAHNERFEFSLYMKGIGMSMSDSLKFWEDAYSKEHSTCSRCTHSWQKNEKRYIYGIRHLYGFEGSRKDYHGRSCTFLQEKSLGPRDEGGCPFKQFDDSNLRSTLESIFPTKTDEVEIMLFERNSNPSISCRMFLDTVYKARKHKDLNENINFKNPVEYYIQLKRKLLLD